MDLPVLSRRKRRRELEEREAEERSSLSDYIEWVNIAGQQFALWGSPSLTLGAKQEEIDPTFDGFASRLFKANPIIFGCAERRRSVFSEARVIKWRNREDGHLFGNESLKLIEEPWPGGSTKALLSRMEQDIFLAGNWFAIRSRGQILRLRPDWMEIVLGGEGFGDPEAVPIGYLYFPGGRGGGKSPISFAAAEVAHYAPTPDPLYSWRGVSPLTSLIREVKADQAATEHKLSYLEEGAVPNTVVKPDARLGPEEFQKFKEIFLENHSGAGKAFSTVFLGGGSDIEVIGSDLKQVDFKAVQALGENRICIATGVPAIIVGASEGLEAATYSNFGQARRAFSDGTVRDLWSAAFPTLEALLPNRPGDAELWFDEGRVAYLQDDEKDRAEVMKEKASAAKMLFEAGFEPESIAKFLTSGDPAQLEHTGVSSIQTEGEAPSTNGNGTGLVVPPIPAPSSN